jgi:diguanylate cyclase (GGDEF)-like protein
VLQSRCRNLLDYAAIAGLVWNARDITEEQQLAEQLAHRAFHDELTGLPNRALFYDRLEQALARNARSGAGTAVIVVDLDRFKPVNDNLGHAAGDMLLTAAAHRLLAAVTPGRHGGPARGRRVRRRPRRGRRRARALVVAEELCRTLRRAVDLGGTTVAPGASVGVAFVRGGATGHRRAAGRGRHRDVRAKAEGGDRARAYGPELRAAHGVPRAEVEALLAEPAGIVAAYQPIISLTTGAVVGYEALARFPGRAHRRPDEWFSLAHRCGLGVELEMKALATALATPGRPPGTYLSINVSPDVLGSPGLERTLPADLTGIVLEITEQSQIDDDVLAGRLQQLRGRGAQLAMDDAGAGYSGLQRLMRMRPDMVKLDRALVSGVDSQPDKAALVEALSFFCRRTGAALCAEGVEEEAELLALADLDVTCAQGFVIAHPAAGWTEPQRSAAAVCLAAYHDLVSGSIAAHSAPGADRQIEHLSAQLSTVTDLDGLVGCLALAAELLHADEVSVSSLDGSGRYVETIAQNGRYLAGRYALADFPATALVLADQVLKHVSIHDPDSDSAEREQLVREGHAGLLMAPLLSDGRSVGLLEVYTASGRPWTRTEVRRVRLISYALGSVLHRLLMRAGASRVPTSAERVAGVPVQR